MNYTMPEKITRKELLDLLSRSTPDFQSTNPPDDLDKKAIEGYQYLDANQHPDDVLENLDNKFDNWLSVKEVSRSKRVRKMTTIQLIQRVAAIALLLLIPTIFIFKPNSTTKLVDQYFDVPRSTYFMVNRGENVSVEPDLHDAFALYEKGDYRAAAEAIEKLIPNHLEKKDLKFYHAISLFVVGEFDQSIDLLLLCSEDNFQGLNQRSPWYLAMAYLKKGDKEAAAKWLKQTLTLDSMHAQNAQNILDKLKL